MSKKIELHEDELKRIRNAIQLQWDTRKSDNEFLDHIAKVMAADNAFIRKYANVIHPK